MLNINASGNITRDATLRQVGDDQVCSLGIAVNKRGKGGEEKTFFVDLNIWGKRGAALQPHLTKGKKVFVSGELDTREHEGKFYLQCRVNELDFGGSGGGGAAKEDAPAPQRDGDDIPF